MFGIVNGILGMFGSEVILGIGGKPSFGIVGPMGKLGSGGIVSPFGKVGKLGCGRDGMEGILGFGKFGAVDWRRLRAASPLSMLIKAKAMNKTKDGGAPAKDEVMDVFMDMNQPEEVDVDGDSEKALYVDEDAKAERSLNWEVKKKDNDQDLVKSGNQATEGGSIVDPGPDANKLDHVVGESSVQK
ncbi:hypothetical protein G4B88_010283 [Cannabis sativa]|uniref:Uncharacterized protein n=1 Tax=Cannabis sativa TaxID=3483 RepID=A0A7J6I700_CANSA|nr:hypothetical protein G4B88_010283 [Cannabis sativa]